LRLFYLLILLFIIIILYYYILLYIYIIFYIIIILFILLFYLLILLFTRSRYLFDTSVTSRVCEKIDQNVAQPIFVKINI
jgi:hypothetical protein